MATSNLVTQKVAAIILCGGASRRMGFDKWKLPFGETTLLDHIVNLLATRVSRIVISVGSHTRPIIQRDELPIVTVSDKYQGCGPLEGIRSSLEYLAPDFEFAFVTACDVPPFDPQVVDFLLHRIGEADAVIPVEDRRVYGLTALYRTAAHKKLEVLIKSQKLRVGDLSGLLNAVLLSTEELRSVDTELNCLTNINCPADYFGILEKFGMASMESYKELEKYFSKDQLPPAR